jgi:hypothetical protein
MAGKPKTGMQRQPDGKVRLSQIVTTFGPGAMVDLLNHAVLIGGTDFWRYNPQHQLPALEEPRLRDAVSKRATVFGLELDPTAPFRKAPSGDDDSPTSKSGISVAEFPTWFVCQTCRALEFAGNLEKKSGKFKHACTSTKLGDCVPVRFVATCRRGHLQEFPWKWFVHQKNHDCAGSELKLLEGPSGDFSETVVQCELCKERRSMGEAREKNVLTACRGERPWLGEEGIEECTEKVQLLSRNASNAYFSQVVSALTIPEKGRELFNAVSSASLWEKLKKATSPEKVGALRQLVDFEDELAALTKTEPGEYTDSDIAEAVNAIHNDATPPREGLRTAEFRQLLAARDENPGELPPRGEDFFACRLVPEDPLPDCVESVILVKKLRRVSALVGFSRLSAATPDLQGDYDDTAQVAAISLTQNWLPATEIWGEGVVIQFKEDAVQAWEELPPVQDRAKKLLEGYICKYGDQSRDRFPGVRYYMLHSLSHLLMNAMALECGYSGAALGERLYCAPRNDELPMAAIMILTGTSGAEGTLGGLVAQGRSIAHHLQRAFDMGRLCSNDPVCAHHKPGKQDHSERYLEGAACHGCLFVSEPSCERFNCYLDRALIVPTLGNPLELAFFAERP